MKIILPIVFILFPMFAFGGSQTSEISGYLPFSNADKEIFIFKLKDNISGGCNATGRFAIDSTSVRFVGMRTALIAAFHAKSKVRVSYDGSCDSWSNTYDATMVCIGEINC